MILYLCGLQAWLVNRVVGWSDLVSGSPPIVAVGAWKFAGATLAGVYPLIQASKVPKSQRVNKGRFYSVIDLVGWQTISRVFELVWRT